MSKPIELEINPELKSLINEGEQPAKFEPRPVQSRVRNDHVFFGLDF